MNKEQCSSVSVADLEKVNACWDNNNKNNKNNNKNYDKINLQTDCHCWDD